MFVEENCTFEAKHCTAREARKRSDDIIQGVIIIREPSVDVDDIKPSLAPALSMAVKQPTPSTSGTPPSRVEHARTSSSGKSRSHVSR
jgi:hypothetical protein